MNEIIIERNELYIFLAKYFPENFYSIGFHGIDFNKLNNIDKNDEVQVIKKIEYIKENILENGLNIYHSRTLLGTVKFYDSIYKNESDFINSYHYGTTKDYCIIALPKILKNDNNNEIYVGSPNPESIYSNEMGTQGYQLTSFADTFIPDYNEGISNLNNCFVFCTLSLFDTDKLKININPKHICFNNHSVSNSFFSRKEKEISCALNSYGISIPIENMNSDELIIIYNSLKNIIEKIYQNWEFDKDKFNINILSDYEKFLYSKLMNYEITTVQNMELIFSIAETIIQFLKYKYNISIDENNYIK